MDAGTLVKIAVVTVVLTLAVIALGGFAIGRLAAKSAERDERRARGRANENDEGGTPRP